MFIAWQTRRNLMVRISVPAHKFRGEDQKNSLRCEILGLVLAFTCAFRIGTRLYSRLGGEGTSSDLGGMVPKCPPWHQACVAHAIEYVIATYFLQAHIHRFSKAHSTFRSKLDEIISGA